MIQTEADFRKLHNVAEGAISAINVKSSTERKEHNWHQTRPKDLFPTVFATHEDWKKWKEEVADYADAVSIGMKEILKMVAKEKEEIDENWFRKNQTSGKKAMTSSPC